MIRDINDLIWSVSREMDLMEERFDVGFRFLDAYIDFADKQVDSISDSLFTIGLRLKIDKKGRLG